MVGLQGLLSPKPINDKYKAHIYQTPKNCYEHFVNAFIYATICKDGGDKSTKLIYKQKADTKWKEIQKDKPSAERIDNIIESYLSTTFVTSPIAQGNFFKSIPQSSDSSSSSFSASNHTAPSFIWASSRSTAEKGKAPASTIDKEVPTTVASSQHTSNPLPNNPLQVDVSPSPKDNKRICPKIKKLQHELENKIVEEKTVSDSVVRLTSVQQDLKIEDTSGEISKTLQKKQEELRVTAKEVKALKRKIKTREKANDKQRKYRAGVKNGTIKVWVASIN